MELRPTTEVRIHSDSRYSIGSLTDWLFNWRSNDLRNAVGLVVANRDLIEEASAFDASLRNVRTVDHVWTPREQKQSADNDARIKAMDVV
jgi:ribonuclease HI